MGWVLYGVHTRFSHQIIIRNYYGAAPQSLRTFCQISESMYAFELGTIFITPALATLGVVLLPLCESKSHFYSLSHVSSIPPFGVCKDGTTRQ